MPVSNARYVSPPNPLAYCGNLYVKQFGYVFVCEVGVAHLSKYASTAARVIICFMVYFRFMLVLEIYYIRVSKPYCPMPVLNAR